MVKLLFTTLLLTWNTHSYSINLDEKYLEECSFNFSKEQLNILDKANIVGYDDNLSLPLQAIVMTESFIWKSVVRTREVSSVDTSYGLGHVRPSTAVWITFKSNLYNVSKMEVKPFLANAEGDILGLYITLEYVKYLQTKSDNLAEVFGRYNAGKYWDHKKGKSYSKKVWNNIKYLEKCLNKREVVYD